MVPELDFTDDDMQIERRIGDLIERGLERYGVGDMEGALAQWKHALALDPENERAANYLEYVEGHHDLGGDLGAESTVELAYPFGVSSLGLAKLTDKQIDDYESFEIVDELKKSAAAAVHAKDPPSVDDGWNVDEGWVADLVQNNSATTSSSTPTPPPLEAVDVGELDDNLTVDVSLALTDTASQPPAAPSLSENSSEDSFEGVAANVELAPSDSSESDFSDIAEPDIELAPSDTSESDFSDIAEPDIELAPSDTSESDFSDFSDIAEPDIELAPSDSSESDFSDIAEPDIDLAPSSAFEGAGIGEPEPDEIEISIGEPDEIEIGIGEPEREPELPPTVTPDDGSTTHVHRPSAKIRSLAGFDELELEGASEHEPHMQAEEDEEEPTHAHVGRVASGPHARDVGSDDLDIDLEEEDEEEESTQFHESPNRVGSSHSAATDFSGIDLDDLELDMSGGTETSLPDLPSREKDTERSDDVSDEVTIDFDDVPDAEELSIDAPYTEDTGLAQAGAKRPVPQSDLNVTRKHFAIDEEMTIDRSALVRQPRVARAPTHDHDISEASIDVNDALLSLQDSTRELDLADMGLAPPGLGTSGVISMPDTSTRETRDLGLRSGAELELEEVDIRIGRASDLDAADVETLAPEGEFLTSEDATAATEQGILAEITRDAPRDDVGERMLYIVNRLIDHAGDEFTEGNATAAASAVCHALDYASDSATAQKIVFENERRLVQILISSLGDAGQVPRLLCPLLEIPTEHINHRAAFLLTRLEQAMTLDELLDVSGMPKLEALRHLCGLHVLGYLEVI